MHRIFGSSKAKAKEPQAPPPDLSETLERGDKRIADLEAKVRVQRLFWETSKHRTAVFYSRLCTFADTQMQPSEFL